MKICVIERARLHKLGDRIRDVGTGPHQVRAQPTEKASERTHAQIAEQVGKHARHDLTVLQGIAGTGGSLGSIGERPPSAVRRPRDVDRIYMQSVAARFLDAVARPEKIGMSERKLRRYAA